MVPQVTTICKSAFYRLRKIRLIRKHLTFDSAQLLVQVLVASKLDYCNSLLNGLAKNVINNKLAYYALFQRVHNAAACVVTLSPKICHITPIILQISTGSRLIFGLNLKYLLLLTRLSMDLLLLKLKIFFKVTPRHGI